MWLDEVLIPLKSIDQRVSELHDLRGKKAVVIGGAGLNLGQACVNRLAGLGADVVVVDLDPSVAAQGRQRWMTPPDAHGIAGRPLRSGAPRSPRCWATQWSGATRSAS